ncbi:MAG: septum formation initiator family protein [Bdellovibrionales bacterium]
MRSVKRGAVALREALDHPGRILIYCLLFFVVTVSLNGTPLRLWGLHRDFERRTSEIQSNLNSINDLKAQIRLAQDPLFIERQARDRLDLVGPEDLIFVFPTR